MRSQRSLFNKSIVFDNISRFWPFSVIVFIITFIVQTASVYSTAGDSYLSPEQKADTITENMLAWQITTIFFSFACAFLVFRYLFSERLCNQIHAFPLSRKTLFFSNALSGFLMQLVPQIINWFLMIPAIFLAGEKGLFAEYLVCILVFNLIFYSLGILAAMLTGNFISMAAVYLTLSFFKELVSLLSNIYSAIFSDSAGYVFTAASPNRITALLSLIFPESVIEMMLESDMYSAPRSFLIIGRNMRYAIYLMYFVFAVLFILLSLHLYKKRSSESAGRAVAFKQIKPFMLIILDIFAAMLVSSFFSVFFDYSAGYLLGIRYIIVGVFVSIGVKMIFDKSVKIDFKKEIIRWGLTVCALTVVFCGIQICGNKYVPKRSDIESVAIIDVNYEYNVFNNNTAASTYVEDDESISELIKIHKSSVNKLIEFSAPEYPYDFYDAPQTDRITDDQYDYKLYYRLNNGTLFYKYIKVKNSETAEKIENIFKENRLNSLLMYLDIKDIDNTVFTSRIEIGRNDYVKYNSYLVTDEEIRELLYAYAEDMKENDPTDACILYFNVIPADNSTDNYIIPDSNYNYNNGNISFSKNYTRTAALIEKIMKQHGGDSLSELD